MVTRKKNYKNNPKIIQMIALAGKNIKSYIIVFYMFKKQEERFGT